MEPLPDTTGVAASLAVSAAMVVLALRKRLLVRRRPVCPSCGVERRACRCRDGR